MKASKNKSSRFRRKVNLWKVWTQTLSKEIRGYINRSRSLKLKASSSPNARMSSCMWTAPRTPMKGAWTKTAARSCKQTSRLKAQTKLNKHGHRKKSHAWKESQNTQQQRAPSPSPCPTGGGQWAARWDPCAQDFARKPNWDRWGPLVKTRRRSSNFVARPFWRPRRPHSRKWTPCAWAQALAPEDFFVSRSICFLRLRLLLLLLLGMLLLEISLPDFELEHGFAVGRHEAARLRCPCAQHASPRHAAGWLVAPK